MQRVETDCLQEEVLKPVLSEMCERGRRNRTRFDLLQIKQEPLTPPSVFNYYHPTFQISNSNLLGPEFELFNSSTTITRVNFVNDAVYGTIGKTMTVDFTYYLTLASTPDQLVDRMGEIMMSGQMSPQTRSEIINAITGISDNTKRVQAALYLVASSSQFQVER